MTPPEVIPTQLLLIAEDPGDARLIHETLRLADAGRFELHHADGLAAGLARLAAGGIEVVLLDLPLPDSQGLATVAAVRAQAPNVAIVVLTGLDDETTALGALQTGAQDYLVKGEVDGRALSRAIRYATQRQGSERRLRESQRQLAESQAHAGLGTYMLDFASSQWTSSDRCDQIFGISGAYDRSVTGWANLIHPDDRPAMLAYFAEEVVDRHRAFDMEYRIVRPSDQAERWVHGLGELTFDDHQQPAAMHGTITDITARKQAEAEIEWLSRFPDESPDPVLRLAADGRLLYANARSQPLLAAWGCAIGQPVPPEVHQRALAALANGQKQEFDVSAGDITYSVSMAPVADKGYVNLYARDVTAVERAHAAIAASEVRFRALVERAPDGITLLSADDILMYASPAIERVLGYRPEDVIGRSPAEITHPDDLTGILEVLMRITAQPGSSAALEYRIRHADGSWRWIDSTVSNQLNNPSVGALVFNFRDATERKQHEREMEALADVAHALRAASSPGEMLAILVAQVQGLLAADSAVITRETAAGSQLVVSVAHGEMARLTGRPVPANAGLVGQILAAGGPVVSADLQADPLFEAANWPAGTRTAAGVPLLTREEALGVLVVSRAAPLAATDVHLLAAIAEMAGNALQRATLHAETQRRVKQLEALRSIDIAINDSLDQSLVLDVVVSQAMRQLGADAAVVLIFDDDSQQLSVAALGGFRTSVADGLQLSLGEGLAGQVAVERRPLVIANLAAHPGWQVRPGLITGEGFVSFVGLPLIAKGEIKGVLEIFHRSALDTSADWLGFAETLAGQAVIAIDNATVYANLSRSNTELRLAYDTTLEGWSRALDLRDHETEGHTQRVMEMAAALACGLGLPAAEIVQLRRGALLHDIGKMGIPDEILRKPGPLSDSEWAVMRQHPVFAYNLLSPIGFLHQALDVPYCHHEKWDGTGYPRGLRGEQIPLAARIFAVADVWDALCSDRPYRPAWPPEQALAYVREQAGQHFDPRVLVAFEAWYAADAATPRAAAPTRPTLLIVDDEENVTRSLERSLRAGFTILVAHSGAAALEILAHEPVAVLLTDQRMAGFTGLELLRQAQAISPATRGLVISGYSDATALAAMRHLENVRGFIPKPWNVADLDRQLHAAAAEYINVHRDQQIIAALRRHEP